MFQKKSGDDISVFQPKETPKWGNNLIKINVKGIKSEFNNASTNQYLEIEQNQLNWVEKAIDYPILMIT